MNLPTLLESNWNYNLDSLPYGWAGQRHISNNIGFEKHFQLYNDLVEWIQETVSSPTQNACWVKIGDCIYVQFRKEKDLIMYLLKFGDNR